MGPFLIDSNIIIYFIGEEIPKRISLIIDEIFNNEPITSIICKIEVLSFNVLLKDDKQIRTLFDYVEVINMDEEIIEETINIRRKIKIKTPDAIIAATAKVRNLTLITRNVKDFNKISGLKIYNPWD